MIAVEDRAKELGLDNPKFPVKGEDVHFFESTPNEFVDGQPAKLTYCDYESGI